MLDARLDHLFVLVDSEEQASIPAGGGFPVVRRGPHSGGGTGNVVYRFGGVLLELAYPIDQDEIAKLGKIGFAERWGWRENGSSPFGVVVQVDRTSPEKLPFATWEYAPPFLPGSCWTIGRASLFEPLYMVVPHERHIPDPVEDPRFLSASVSCAGMNHPSPVARALDEWNACTVRPGSRAEMELNFASESVMTLDLRPEAPLILRNVRDESVTVEGSCGF